MTPEAQHILTLIERVSPDDEKTLDEIDARVWCYLNNSDHEFKWQRYCSGQAVLYVIGGSTSMWQLTKEYTRDRNALKALRPDGIFLKHWYTIFERYVCEIDIGEGVTRSPDLPTEELSELWCIISAIDYQRGQK